MTSWSLATKPASTSSGSKTNPSNHLTIFPPPTSSPRKSSTTSNLPWSNSASSRMTFPVELQKTSETCKARISYRRRLHKELRWLSRRRDVVCDIQSERNWPSDRTSESSVEDTRL